MRKTILAILLLGLTGCMSGAPENAPVECAGECSSVNFSTPNGNDLKLETDHHIVHNAVVTAVGECKSRNLRGVRIMIRSRAINYP